MIKKSDLRRIVTKTFIKNKSGRCQKIRAKTAVGYSGLSEHNVLKITEMIGSQRTQYLIYEYSS